MENVKNTYQKEPNRWIILIMSVIMNISVGSAYAWSVFQTPLIEMFGWGTSETSIAYTLSLALVPIAMIIGGQVVASKGPRIVALVGGVVFGIGFFLAGFSSSLTTLYLTYGVLGGLGIGFVYGITVSNTVKWFPDKRGLAGGLTAGGFGSGAVIIAPLAASMIESIDVLNTFKIFGLVFLVVIVLSALFMKQPVPGWTPAGWVAPATTTTTAASAVDLGPGEMLKTGRFYILWLMCALGMVSGLMIIGHASPIGQEQINLTPQMAALAVSIIAIANTFGRIFWGWVSDKIGRYNAIVVMFLLSAVMLLVLNIATTLPLFLISTMCIALSYGGFMGIMPSLTADSFGSKNLSINYGIVFTGFGLAAIVGPRIASVAKETSGGLYSSAYIISSVMNVVGVLITIYLIMKIKKEQKKATEAKSNIS